MSDFRKNLEEWKDFGSNPESFIKFIPVFAMVFVLLTALFTCWAKIEPQERGVVLRFGKFNKTMEPGLHFRLPFRIDRVEKVPVQRQLKEEFGYRTKQSGIRTQYSSQNLDGESIMLTGDLNVADVEWVTQYRIVNPRDYLFKVRNLKGTFRVMNEAVMREIVGDRTINEILTTGRSVIENLVEADLQKLCNQYEMGVEIDQVILQDVNPPELVKPSFNGVNQAQQEKESQIYKARAEYNSVIPRAEGEASQVIEMARGYAIERINMAAGEADRFNAIYKAYQKAPEVTRQRLYLESMQKVLAQVGRKIIVDHESSGILPLLNLSPEGGSK
ncbi:MAG TPA: FtsH protease activity modulator HflK [Verrucomicrobiales bacterium]|nr:FtsH protease activity modulator HflK [Verrucomicrobiales bacterium]HIL70436.1 FtsH protease activity modulator HflK [Verrucomicrobiota bacterium]